jgi:Tfp pilus assembly protein PilV
MRPVHRHRAGLTLLEVLVAMLVLTAGILTTITTQLAVARLRAHDTVRLRAAAAAAGTLDSLRAVPCQSLTSGNAVEPDAHLAWNVLVARDLAEVQLAVTPRIGAPWAAETLSSCA